MTPSNKISLQDKYAPKSTCFGCGPCNTKGLQIKSFIEDNKVIAHFTPKAYQHAFSSTLHGGIIGAIFDCHCNWAACWYLMQENKLHKPPCTVTAEFNVKFKRPAPTNQELLIIAEPIEIKKGKARIRGHLLANKQVCDEFTGIFIAVKPSHPAFNRW